jgi:hypothetical protein
MSISNNNLIYDFIGFRTPKGSNPVRTGQVLIAMATANGECVGKKEAC